MGYTWKRDSGSLLLLIAVIIVVVIIVLVLKPVNAVPMPIEQTFHVSMQCVGGPLKYVVNNDISPTLKLKKGKKYRFVLDHMSEPLYLTTSNVGGDGVPGSIADNVDERGIVDKNGDMFIIMDRDAKPGMLYYQSTKSQHAGGMIIIS